MDKEGKNITIDDRLALPCPEGVVASPPPAASASEAAIAQLVPEGSDPFRYCTVKIRAQWSDLVLMKLFRATPDGC